ncbi:hypothetical protein GIB67_000970 [Kingdonia uniflora]|uniref:F-box domain-containing protein n=1 Tax=Kingdonia uniflora TaxID=39325 RepID=A0A7J7MFU9_9MAGN|nr:hypothetical protein GIB67_000970 [Kingdonia uniflora]
MVERRPKFYINDHPDVLLEILTRLDDRSLGIAASVCQLWCSITRHDSLWENLCFRRVSPTPSDVKPVVLALGGYRRLYMVCIRPVLNRLCVNSDRVWTRDEVQLSLSLFSIDYYERLSGNGRLGGGTGTGESTKSLMFLCDPVKV